MLLQGFQSPITKYYFSYVGKVGNYKSNQIFKQMQKKSTG